MIASKYIYTTPFKRRNQTEMSHQKNLEALDWQSVPSQRRRKRVVRVIRKVGTNVFRVTSGGIMDTLSSEFKNKIQTHGTLLAGRPDLAGLMNYVQQNKDRVDLHIS